MQRVKKEWLRVRFRAKGLSLEKMIRMAGDEQITLSRMRRLNTKEITGYVSEQDYLRLKEMADKRGWEIEKGKAIGVAAVRDKLKRRYGVLAGAALLIAVMAIALQFIWVVDVLDAGAYEADVKLFVAECGIKPGVLKRDIALNELQNKLEWRYPNVAWVKVAYRGSNLVVRMIEGIPTPKVESVGDPNDVIARVGGIVTSVEPYAGTPLVKLGDVVRAGQVLIRGQERAGKEGEMRDVKARGVVKARTWVSAKAVMPLNDLIRTPTGRESMYQAIETPFITLLEGEESGFTYQDTLVERYPIVGAFFPVTLKRVTRMEVECELRPREQAQIKRELEEAAYSLLAQKVNYHDELVDKWVDYCMIEGKEMEAVAVGEVLANIALVP